MDGAVVVFFAFASAETFLRSEVVFFAADSAAVFASVAAFLTPPATVEPASFAVLATTSVTAETAVETTPCGDPLDAAVITCGSIHGGHGYNIIADEVKVSGTVRSFTAETQQLLRTRMADICAGTARTYGGEIELDYKYGYPATVNTDAPSVALVRDVGAAVVGADRAALECKTCGAEDFSSFLQQRPGAFFFVGAALPGEPRPHHKSVFDFDEDALLVSAAMFLGIVERYLGAGGAGGGAAAAV